MTTITKKILLMPGGSYEFTVTAPQELNLHAFDAEIKLQPGDKLHLTISAPPHPQPKAAVMPLPEEQRIAS